MCSRSTDPWSSAGALQYCWGTSTPTLTKVVWDRWLPLSPAPHRAMPSSARRESKLVREQKLRGEAEEGAVGQGAAGAASAGCRVEGAGGGAGAAAAAAYSAAVAKVVRHLSQAKARAEAEGGCLRAACLVRYHSGPAPPW
jgi:hypothetical protein